MNVILHEKGNLRDAVNERLDELKAKFTNTRSYGYKKRAKRFEDYLNLIDTVAETIFAISGNSQLNYIQQNRSFQAAILRTLSKVLSSKECRTSHI